jgi:hypothetical protein
MLQGMAALVWFNSFSEGLAKGEHNFSTHAFKVYLTNAAPNVATMVNKADLAEIAAANGYTAGGSAITNTVSRTGATTSINVVDVTLTSSGAGFGPFRYVVVYNDTHASKALVGYYDYGSSITPANGETFVTDFATTLMTLSLG